MNNGGPNVIGLTAPVCFPTMPDRRGGETPLKQIPLPVRLLLWIPRLLAMGFILLLAMYSVDVFVDGRDFLDTGTDFVLRLVPAFSALCILAVGWRRDGLAALGFLVLAVAYLVALRGWRGFPESAALFIPPAGLSLSFFARMKLVRRMAHQPDKTRAAPESIRS